VIWDYAEGSKPESGDGAIHLCEDVSSMGCLTYYYHRTYPSRLSLPVKGCFYTCIPNKNKVARSKLVGADFVSIFLLELADGCKTGFDDSVLDGVKILWSPLESSGSEHYKFGGHHSRLQWNHVHCFSEVKQKDGVRATLLF
jgi:hypothetical protein